MGMVPDFAPVVTLAFSFAQEDRRPHCFLQQLSLFSCVPSILLCRVRIRHPELVLPKHSGKRAALQDTAVLALRGIDIFSPEGADRHDVPTCKMAHVIVICWGCGRVFG